MPPLMFRCAALLCHLHVSQTCPKSSQILHPDVGSCPLAVSFVLAGSACQLQDLDPGRIPGHPVVPAWCWVTPASCRVTSVLWGRMYLGELPQFSSLPQEEPHGDDVLEMGLGGLPGAAGRARQAENSRDRHLLPPHCLPGPVKVVWNKPGCAFRDISQLFGTFLSFSKASEAAGSIIFPARSMATLEEVTAGRRTFVGSSPSPGRGPGGFLVTCNPTQGVPTRGHRGGSVRTPWEVPPNSEPQGLCPVVWPGGHPGQQGGTPGSWQAVGSNPGTPRAAGSGAGWDTARGRARAGGALGG